MRCEKGIMLVTGASRGIGAAIARLASRHGYAVCINHRDSAEQAQQVQESIIAEGGQAFVIQADMGREEDIQRLFQELDLWRMGRMGRMGRVLPLTALVNNAAKLSGVQQPFIEMKSTLIQQILDVNLLGVMLCTQEALRRMVKSRGGQGGNIIHVSSQAGVFGGRQMEAYAASKAAINIFTIGLARDMAAEGVRVNTVSPGVIASGVYSDPKSEELAKVNTSIPLGYAGSTTDVAEAVLWLASEKATYITGVVLPIAGGR